MTNGSYALWAAALDNSGLMATSSIVNVTVSPLLVSLTSPTNNASYIAPGSVALAATTLDYQGSIRHVDFYAGTDLLASVVSPPYAYTWSNVAAGRYALWAAATDTAGLAATSSVALSSCIA